MSLFATNLKSLAFAGMVALTSMATTSVATAEELDTLKEKGVMRIAMTGAYPPFNFVSESNEVVGFDACL